MSQPNPAKPADSPEIVRLPCRGCRADCPNYGRCGGKPWRMEAEAK